MQTKSKPHVVYAHESAPDGYTKAIFLAGPSPRDGSQSWRRDAIQIAEELGYDGVIFVPEPRGPRQPSLSGEAYMEQVEWEERHMHMADVILFWVPRDDQLPGLTTNVEWGRWENSGKVVIGAPDNAHKVRYLLHYAAKYGAPNANNLRSTVGLALDMVGEGAWRTGGEREVPLSIWTMARFQRWYSALRAAGNTLEHARVVWSFGTPARPNFFWALHAEVMVTAEGRTKSNEILLSRPDISTIVLYQRAKQLDDSVVVLIREYRTPTLRGYVYEVPGGSKTAGAVGDTRALAAEECYQETGLLLEASRFTVHGARQMVATLSIHQAHLYSAELTDAELDFLRDRYGTAYGVAEDTEQTYVELSTLGELRRQSLVDWSMLGMIMLVLTN